MDVEIDFHVIVTCILRFFSHVKNAKPLISPQPIQNQAAGCLGPADHRLPTP